MSKIEGLLNLANRVLATKKAAIQIHGKGIGSVLNEKSFQQFRTSSLSFIFDNYGDQHPYYIEFTNKVNGPTPSAVKRGKGILQSISDKLSLNGMNS